MLVLAHETRPLERGDGWIRGHHTIEIAVMATDQDSQQLCQRIQRYVLAIFELLVEAESSSGWQVIHEAFSADYDQVYTADDSFISDGRLMVTASKLETM